MSSDTIRQSFKHSHKSRDPNPKERPPILMANETDGNQAHIKKDKPNQPNGAQYRLTKYIF